MKKKIPYRYATLQMSTIKNGRDVIAYEFTFNKESKSKEEIIEIEATPITFQSIDFFEKLKNSFGESYDVIVKPYVNTIDTSIKSVQNSQIIEEINNLSDTEAHDFFNNLSYIIDTKSTNTAYIRTSILNYFKKS